MWTDIQTGSMHFLTAGYRHVKANHIQFSRASIESMEFSRPEYWSG